MSEVILKWIAPIHRRYRKEKSELFFSCLAPSPSDSLLDVGGGSGAMSGEFATLYRFFRNVQVVNSRPQLFCEAGLTHVRFDLADGCALPYPDRAFDWVFSNAVIEHVGDRSRQVQFATEIRRVARKGYFVATPNRHFPIDPHTLLPYYQFLKPSIQRYVCRFSLGYVKEYEPIDLLSARALRELFPDATLRMCGSPLIPNNLVVFRKNEKVET